MDEWCIVVTESPRKGYLLHSTHGSYDAASSNLDSLTEQLTPRSRDGYQIVSPRSYMIWSREKFELLRSYFEDEVKLRACEYCGFVGTRKAGWLREKHCLDFSVKVWACRKCRVRRWQCPSKG